MDAHQRQVRIDTARQHQPLAELQRKAAKARRRATSTQEDRDLRGRLAAERNKAH
jgi:hypothetical protein